MARAKLTAKQQRFAEAYSGNGVEAARLAGYSGSYDVLNQVARENLQKPLIAAAIAKRESKVLKPLIASREERQAFWTEAMKAAEHDMGVRLKASELLGKSEADFTDKTEHSGNLTVTFAFNGIIAEGDE